MLKTSTAQRGNGIQWTPWTKLDDLDFADDLALLSRTQRQMQKKTNAVANNSARLGLKIHRGNSKVVKNNTAASTTPISLEGDGLVYVTSFTYIGSIVEKTRGEGTGRGLMPM